jgi:3-phosphoshikimate 1-carboxyvinyltransferase
MTTPESFAIANLSPGFEASITLPGSKSIALRQLAIGALVNGVSHIKGIPACDDTDAMIDCLQALGVSIWRTGNNVTVQGPMDFGEATVRLNPRMSGASTRLLIALAALRSGKTHIDGHPSLQVRTNQPLFDVLARHGCDIKSDGGGLPAEISGPVTVDGSLEIDGTLSSQYITALMIIAPVLAQHQGRSEQTIDITGDLVSRPYLEITRNEMRKRQVHVEWANKTRLTIPATPYRSGDYLVEGDASAASYFLALATLHAGTITLTNLDDTSVQGDYRFCDVMEALGSTVERQGMTRITGPEKLTPLNNIDMQEMPDVALTLIAMAPMLPEPIEITGLQSLHHKECDRLECPARELKVMGIDLTTTYDSITIVPLDHRKPKPHQLTTYHDHRMAMAFSTLGSTFGNLSIDDKNVVNKTYPSFWDDYAQLST